MPAITLMDLSPSGFISAPHLNIGIISDTHGRLRSEAVNALQGSDVILHAGDIGGESILDELGLIAPVYAVRGNVDCQPWCHLLPERLSLRLSDLRIHIIHDLGHLDRSQIHGFSMVVYGHSHQPGISHEDGIVFLNPGSAGPRRFSLPVSVAKLFWQFGDEKVAPQLIQLP